MGLHEDTHRVLVVVPYKWKKRCPRILLPASKSTMLASFTLNEVNPCMQGAGVAYILALGPRYCGHSQLMLPSGLPGRLSAKYQGLEFHSSGGLRT